MLVTTRLAVLRTLYQIQTKYRRTYSTVKRTTIRKYLQKFYNINICLSTISYHLTRLRQSDIIRVYERYGRAEDGTVYNVASNRQFTAKGLMYLKAVGISVKQYLYNWAFKGIKPPQPKRRASKKRRENITTRPTRRSAAPMASLGTLIPGAVDTLT